MHQNMHEIIIQNNNFMHFLRLRKTTTKTNKLSLGFSKIVSDVKHGTKTLFG